MRNLALGIIMGLFCLCFIAIIVENAFLGGRRRRKLEREARERAVGGEG